MPHVIAHLRGETHEEVERGQGEEQHFEIHKGEAEQFEYLAYERSGINHQPRHHGHEDYHDAEENYCKRQGSK